MSGTVIGSLEIQMMADMARIRNDMADAKGIVGGAMGEIQAAVAATTRMLGLLGVGASVGGLVALVEKTIEGASEMYKLSEKTGVAVNSLSALRSAAKLSGTSMDDVAGGLQKLSKNMVDAQGGTGKAAAAFNALGVSLVDGNGKLKSADVVMLDVAKSMQGFEQGAGTTAAMMAIFGKAGANLIPMLIELAEKGDLNGKVTAEQARQAHEFEVAQIRLKASIDGVVRGIALDLIPVISKTSQLFGPAVEVAAGYVAVMYGIPAVMALGAGAIDALAATMIEGSAAATGFSVAMGQTVGATMASVAAFGVLRSAGMLALAAFAGWEIGSWLRENFETARLAGVAFVDGIMTGWEAIKYAGSAMWLELKDIIFGVFDFAVTTMSDAVAGISKGLKAMGFDDAAAATSKFADSMKTAGTVGFDFKGQMAALDAQYDTNVAAVHAITDEMADEAIAYGKSATTGTEHKKVLTDIGDAADKAASQYAQFMLKVNGLIEQRKLELAGGKAVTEADKLAIEAKAKLAGAERDVSLAKVETLRQLDDEWNEMQRATKAIEAANQARVAEYNTVHANVGKLAEEIAQQQAVNQTLVDGRDNTTALTVAKLNDMAATADRNAMIALEREGDEALYAAYRDQAAELRTLATLKADAVPLKEAKDAADAWKKTTDSINAGLTDALMRAFESGKGFWEAFTSTLANAAKTLVLKPIIEFVVRPVSNLIGNVLGGASTGGSTSGSSGTGYTLMNGATYYNAYKALAAGFGGLELGTANAAGTMYANATGTGIDGLLATNGAYGTASAGGWGSTMGTMASTAAGVMGGIYGGRYISGGYAIGGGSGNGMVNTGTALGALVGSIIPGLGTALGALVGGLLGGVANRAFGHGPTQLAGQGVQGTLGAGSFVGNTYADMHREGGFFTNDQNWTEISAVPAELQSALAGGASGILEQAKRYGAVLKLPVAQLASVSTQMRVELGTDATANSKAITTALNAYGDDLVNTFADSLKPFNRATETNLQTLERLGSSLLAVNGVFDTLNMHLVATSAAGGQAASDILDLTGGLDAFLQKTQGYLQDYFTQAEQYGVTAAALLQQLGAAGIDFSGATGRGDLRNLMQSIDPNAAGGSAQIAALLNSAGDFAKVADYLGQQGLTLGQLAALAPQNTGFTNGLATGSSASGADTSTALLATANDHLTAIASSSQDNTTQLQALVTLQSAANAALLQKLQDMSTALEAANRPAYMQDIGVNGYTGA